MTVAMGFGQSREVFVSVAMARGHRRAGIEVVVGYQPVWCIYPTIGLSSTLMKLQVQWWVLSIPEGAAFHY